MEYSVARAGWAGDYPDPHTFMDLMLTNGGNNKTGFSSKEYDDLIAQATHTKDNKSRFALYEKADAILGEEVPIIPIYFYTSKYLRSPLLQGWPNNVMKHHPYQFVSIAKAK